MTGLPFTMMGAARLALKVSPALFLPESSSSLRMTLIFVPAGIFTGVAAGAAVAGAGVLAGFSAGFSPVDALLAGALAAGAFSLSFSLSLFSVVSEHPPATSRRTTGNIFQIF